MQVCIRTCIIEVIELLWSFICSYVIIPSEEGCEQTGNSILFTPFQPYRLDYFSFWDVSPLLSFGVRMLCCFGHVHVTLSFIHSHLSSFFSLLMKYNNVSHFRLAEQEGNTEEYLSFPRDHIVVYGEFHDPKRLA